MATNSKEIATRQEKSKFIETMIAKQRSRIEEMLGTPEAAARALRVYHTACTRMPKLLDCSPRSILNGIVSAAEFKLDINTPAQLAFLIPYGDEATFQLGYRGIMEMGYRSGVIADIQPRVLFENDEFEIEYGMDEKLRHRPLMKGDRGKAIGYYAIVTYITGEKKFEYWTNEQCLDHAKQFSKAYSYAENGYNGKPAKKDSPWHTNFDVMAMKTVIIATLKYAPKSIDDNRAEMLAPLRKAVALDVANDRGILPEDMGVTQLLEDDRDEEELGGSGSQAMDKFVNDRKPNEPASAGQDEEEDEPPFETTAEEVNPETGEVKMQRPALIAAIEETRKDMGIKGRIWGVMLSDAGSKDATLDGLTDAQLDTLLTKLEEQQAAAAK